MTKLVRLVAVDPFDNELGAIDGEEITIGVTDDGELEITNGRTGLFGPVLYGWEDLVPDYRRGDPVRLELEIVEGIE